MAQFDLTLTGTRPEPLIISVKKVGDALERFITRSGNTITFNSVTGDNVVYESTVTDANGKVSKKQFPLTCARPANCDEGPEVREILSFSNTSITYKFHGVNVQKIRREILKDNVLVDVRIDEPTQNVVTSPYISPLSAGRYNIQLYGESCYSGDNPAVAREFIITDDNVSLDWYPGYPTFEYDALDDQYSIIWAVNAASSEHYEIRNSLNQIIHQGHWTLSPGELFFIKDNFQPDTYTIEWGPLTYSLNINSAPAQCTEGPKLSSVESLNSAQTKFQFNGQNVFIIRWYIRNLADVILQTGLVEPTSSIVTINHDPLPGGNYNLRIEGSSCTTEPGFQQDLDFAVAGANFTLGDINVSQLSDGRYQLVVNFAGGVPNYFITVRTQGNSVIGSYPNTTGSPSTITLPTGTAPQTVKVRVEDSNSQQVENNNVVLPAPAVKLNFMQADNFSSIAQRTPMVSDGGVYYYNAQTSYNWDVEAVLPNGGLWDYIEKRARRKEGGVFVEKNLTAALGQAQSYSVSTSTGAVQMFLPRTGQNVIIDGQNIFKKADEWEFRFIFRKGGASGAIVGQVTRTFIIAAPPTLSGITLYNRNGFTLGSAIQELNTTGTVLPKPTPNYDFAVTGFDGVAFTRIYAVYRLKQNSTYVQKFSALLDFGTTKTTITASDFSLFKVSQDVGTSTEIFTQGVQDWQIEFIGYNGQTPIGSKKSEFRFSVAEGQFANPGIVSQNVAGRQYLTTNGMDFGINVLPSGNVKIYHPASRQSLNGQGTCYPWIYYNHLPMHPDDLAALKGSSGLNFPSGLHSFLIKWHTGVVQNYGDVIDGGGAGNAYNLGGADLAVSGKYTAMDDYIHFSIVE